MCIILPDAIHTQTVGDETGKRMGEVKPRITWVA